MAKKTPKQPEENLLSQRLKRTDHRDKKGLYGQQAEINIVVPNDETNQRHRRSVDYPPQQDNPAVHNQYQEQQPNFEQTNIPSHGMGNGFNNIPFEVPQDYTQQPYQSEQYPNNPYVPNPYQQNIAPPEPLSQNYQSPDTTMPNNGDTQGDAPSSTFDVPATREHKRKSSFRDRLSKSDKSQNNEEFTFNADQYGTQQTSPSSPDAPQFDERYTNMFRKNKKKNRDTAKEEGNGLEALSGKNGNPFKKNLPKRTRIIMIVSIIIVILLLPQLIFRIPAAINSQDALSLKLNIEDKAEIINYIKGQNGMGDWDKDGLSNSQDEDPFDPDTDRNGIPDGNQSTDFLKIGDIMKYENVTLEIQNYKMGVSKFLDYYVFHNYKGWAKITNEKGIPYIYTQKGWVEAEYTVEKNSYMVNIPSDCYVEFVEKGTTPVYRTDFFGDKAFAEKESRYVESKGSFAPTLMFMLKTFLPVTEPTNSTIASVWYSDSYHISKEKSIVKAEAVMPNTQHYGLTTLNDYEFSYKKLYELYENIDSKKTVLISIIREDGSEAVCFAYAYDYLGNIYVADANTSKTAGLLKIKPMSQVYCQNGQNYIRQWYEIEGLGFSSEAGDKMFVHMP